ncbi:MAG: nuclear transport factor 2 family protein [Planctomycetes bacterium]|nr:nuclear transport factor 2 family protein [Planctomycetota bacterium]MCB9905914.1 nuclear transport factor 2 family protein [Planctomycetota bacterium]
MNDAHALVRGLYAAFAAGDVPGLFARFAPDIVWKEAEGNVLADGNPYVGEQAILSGVFARLLEEWPDFRVVVDEIVGGPEVVTMFGRYQATHAKTGKALDVQCAHTWWLADGKVTRFQQMVDTLGLDAAAK